MPKCPVLYPSSARTLQGFGQRLKDARLRRRFSAETVAARAGITRQTLTKIESGSGSVAMGNYFRVLAALGLEKDMNYVAQDDVLGRRLQDEGLPQRARAPRRTKAEMQEATAAPLNILTDSMADTTDPRLPRHSDS